MPLLLVSFFKTEIQLSQVDSFQGSVGNNCSANFKKSVSLSLSIVIESLTTLYHSSISDKFDIFCKNDKTVNYQGSHWAPHVVHKDLWNEVGGFSEEFNPGDGSDPDFCYKLWNKNIRIFKTFSKWKVYHFGSATTRKSKNITINKGTKIFF